MITIVRYACAFVLIYKALVENKISDTVAQDPMEIWIAVSIAILLVSNNAKKE